MSHFEIWEAYMRNYDFLTHVDSYTRNIQDVAAAVAFPRLLREGAEGGVGSAMRILDAGSGTGNLSIALKEKGAQVVSCDFSPSALKKHLAKDQQANTLQASLEEPLPLADKEFDAVCCASVLFTLTERGCRLALREFSRVLKPGGQLVVTVPAPNQRNGNLIGLHFGGLMKKRGVLSGIARGLSHLPALARILYYNRKLGKLPDWQGFHRFSEAELRRCIAAAGFADLAVERTYGNRFLLVTAIKAPMGAHQAERVSAWQPQAVC